MPKYYFIYLHRVVLKFLQNKEINWKSIREITNKGVLKENMSYQIQNMYEVKSTLLKEYFTNSKT